MTQDTIAELRRSRFWLKGDGSVTFPKPADGRAGGATATKEQALASAALDSLKFVYMNPKDGRAGGDQEYEATRQTIQFLRGK